MSIYYQDDDCVLHCGDCLAVMPTLEAGTVNMVCADPPYGTTACEWDSVIPLELLWAELKRLIEPRAAVVMTSSQPFTTTLIVSNREWFKYCWVWVKSVKTGFQHAKNAPMKRHEDIVVFSPGVVNHEAMTTRRMSYNPQLAPGKPYRKTHVNPNVGRGGLHRATRANLLHVGTVVENDGTRMPDTVLEFPQGNQHTEHPTQKPDGLMEYLVRTYTDEGDTVLDFCCGSGTTGVACKNTGRKCILIEREPAYCEISARRLRAARESTALFALAESPAAAPPPSLFGDVPAE